MTNRDKAELRSLCKDGYSFEYIRDFMDCSDATIRRYMKVFSPKPAEPDPNGFELQDDGTVTSAGDTSNTLKTQVKTSNVEKVLQNVNKKKTNDVLKAVKVLKNAPVPKENRSVLYAEDPRVFNPLAEPVSSDDELLHKLSAIFYPDGMKIGYAQLQRLEEAVKLLHSYGDTREIDALENLKSEFDKHAESIGLWGMNGLVLDTLARSGDISEKQRLEREDIVTERRAMIVLHGVVNGRLAELKKMKGKYEQI